MPNLIQQLNACEVRMSKSIKFDRSELNATSAASSTRPVEYSTELRLLLYTSNFSCAESNAKIILNCFKLCFIHNSTFLPKCHTRFGWKKMEESDAMYSSCASLSAMFEIARENTRSKKGLGTKLTKPLL